MSTAHASSSATARAARFSAISRSTAFDLSQLGGVTPEQRRFPSDHAKWVERPHGHATVSGERRLYAHATASLTDVGRQEPPLRSASQDTWALGRPCSRREAGWRERRQRRAHAPPSCSC